MRNFLFLITCVFSHLLVHAKINSNDTCKYQFVENGTISHLNKLINVDEIIKSNIGKEFYLAIITISDDVKMKKNIIVRDCSNIDDGKIVLFNGLVIDFNFENIKIDTTILFSHIGDSTKVTFNANECGQGFHSDLKILIFKIRNKYFVGYSIDGSDLMAVFKQISEEYFLISDKDTKNKFFSHIMAQAL